MAQNEQIASEPRHGVLVERDIMVPTRDGTKIALDIYRPDSPGKFPALLAMSPYGKDTQAFDTPPQPFGKSIFEASIEAGDPYYFARRGYVYAIGDVRGTGKSEGEYEGLYSHYEGEDGADVVEWLAEQPWCDGGVGLSGICYFAGIQLHIAAQQPPHLKAICPWEIFGDNIYTHGPYEGGVLNIFFYGLYTGTHPARVGYAPRNVVSAMSKYTPPKELEQLVEKAKANPDLRQYPYLYHLLCYPQKNPLLFDFMLNPLDGPFWKERSFAYRLDKIKVPTYIGGPFFSFFSLPQAHVWNTVKVPKKMFLYSHMGTRPWKANHDEVLRWFDYWLKGMDTGIMEEPPIRYYVTGADRWRTASEYPLENTVWTKFYLNSLGQLTPEPELYNDAPDCFVQQPLFVSEERAKVVYVTPPLPKDMQVTGSPVITFYAAIDQEDTNFRIDVREEGSTAPLPLAQGWLKASHRAIDEQASTPWELAHDHTRAVPVKPGEIYEYKVQLRPLSYLFRAGSRIRLEISSIDVPTDPETYDLMWHVCNAVPTLHKIYRDAEHPSYLVLPVIPEEG